MSRQEFLQRLREALTGEVTGSVIEENIRYYEEYITTEVRNGSTEEAVIASIGDPRLIARTIFEASENAKESGTGRTYYESYSGADRNVYEDPGDFRRHMHYIDLNKWYWKLLAVVVVILFFTLVLTIIGGILTLMIPLLPVIGIVALVMWLVRGPRG